MYPTPTIPNIAPSHEPRVALDDTQTGIVGIGAMIVLAGRAHLLTINDGEVFKPCNIDKILIYEKRNDMSYVV